MRVLSTGPGLEVWAPAKLNLFLEVLAKREDGYHEIESLMCPIDLYDTLYFRDEPSGEIAFSCELVPGIRDANAPEELTFPEGTKNLVVQAIELLRRETGNRAGARIHLVKRIPIAAGLGGGSSDAAAALVAANQVWRTDLPQSALAELAAQLGSDVPFFLANRWALARGRGERVEPVSQLALLHFVVVRPPVGLSTSAVYAACHPRARSREPDRLVSALRNGDIHRAGRLLHNRLQEAAETKTPWIGRLRDAFAMLDVLGHQMTGSGACYFGFCRHARHARRIAAYLKGCGVGRVYAVRTCP